MMGGLASTYVPVSTPLKIASTQILQLYIYSYSILPGVLPLIVVLLVWKYLSKKRNYFRATVGLTIVSLVLGCLGVII
jgi:PTS system mannose-specific IID component